MPKPLETFWKTARANDVDDELLSIPVVESTLGQLEDYGKDLGERAERFFKKTPIKPSGPTPTYQESAFLKPKTETTLYNVTNSENRVPVTTRASRIFKHLSYSVSGFSAAATHKDGDNAYSLIAGERVGFNFSNYQNHTRQGVRATYNVYNGKSELKYSYSDPLNSGSISLFNQNSNVGLSAYYANRKVFESTISVDRNSASAECSYTRNTQACSVELGAYATTGEKYSNPFVGFKGRVSF